MVSVIILLLGRAASRIPCAISINSSPRYFRQVNKKRSLRVCQKNSPVYSETKSKHTLADFELASFTRKRGRVRDWQVFRHADEPDIEHAHGSQDLIAQNCRQPTSSRSARRATETLGVSANKVCLRKLAGLIEELRKDLLVPTLEGRQMLHSPPFLHYEPLQYWPSSNYIDYRLLINHNSSDDGMNSAPPPLESPRPRIFLKRWLARLQHLSQHGIAQNCLSAKNKV